MPRVLVTGANRGIGLEFARQYAADGWQVVACCRQPDKAEALKKIKGEVTIEALDVTDDQQIARLAARLKGQPIDLLINNAGVVVVGPVENMTRADFEHRADVNRAKPLFRAYKERAQSKHTHF